MHRTIVTMSLCLFSAWSLAVSGQEPRVARAILTTAVEDREPVTRLDSPISTDQPQVVLFTDLRDMGGQTVTHRWRHGGETRAEVSFPVGGPRWRVWSSKRMRSDWQGQWRVQVLDSQGDKLHETTFIYGELSP